MNTHYFVPGRGRSASLIATGVLLALALAGCAEVTSLDSEPRLGKYQVTTSMDPKTVNPPQYGTLSYSLLDTTNGKPVTQYQPTSGALLHNVLISRDLQHFWHSYTQDLTDHTASVSAYFPIFSKYYSYALFTPLGGGQEVLTSTIVTGNLEGDPPNLTPETSPIKTVGWLTFALVQAPGAIKRGAPTQLVFSVRERGYPVTALWPLLGSPAHLWVVDESGSSFGHEVASSQAHNYGATPQPGQTATPTTAPGSTSETAAPTPTLPPPPTFAPGIATALATTTAFTPQPIPPVQQTAQSSVFNTPEVLPGVGYGPDLAFTHTFPHAGLYKCWAEVLYRNQIVTVSYVIKVVE